jgi:tRNA A-37 threonylcarbamoyl transferase component Bud32
LDALVEFVEFLMPNGTTIKSEIVVPKFFTETPNQIVSNILGRTGMEQYTTLFLSQGYMDPFIISSLEEIDIVAMGLPDPEHIKGVCKAIEILKSSGLASSQSFSLSTRMDQSTEAPLRTTTTTATTTEGASAASEQEESREIPKSKRAKKTSLLPIKQVEALLKPFAIKFDDLLKEKTLKSGFFEEVYVCQWKGQTVVARNMPSKTHQYEQFVRQAATILSFKHPSLMLPVAVCTEEPNLCLVNKWMEKGSLYDVLEKEGASLSPLQRVQIALEVAEALLYLHSQSPAPFLHNDLASRNVLLDSSLRPHLNNFGLARPPSFLWMAPEVFSKKKYSPAADVFSLGVVLWELLTGYHPFEGTPPSVAVLRVSKDGLRLPLPLAKKKDADEEIVEAWVSLIRSCWHAEPSQRPSTKTVVERVREIHNSVSSLSPPPSAFSFASTFVPFSAAHKVQRSASSPIAPLAAPSPLSAPASLGTKSAEVAPADAATSVPEHLLNVTVEEMESMLHDMQGLLHRVRSLQENFDSFESSSDDDESTTSDDSESVSSSFSSSDSPPPSPASVPSSSQRGGRRGA